MARRISLDELRNSIWRKPMGKNLLNLPQAELDKVLDEISKNKNNISRKQWTEREIYILKALLAKGVTHRKIAEVLGRTLPAVDGKAQGI